ncbi:MAG: hypothetical protein AB7E32_09210 [Desulfovibrio sp.]
MLKWLLGKKGSKKSTDFDNGDWKSKRRFIRDENEYGVAAWLAREEDTPPIDRAFIARFGGFDFLFNFRMWAGCVKHCSIAEYSPVGDYYRSRFEALASSGAVVTGAGVSNRARLYVLSIRGLRDAAAELSPGLKFKSIAAGVEKLESVEGIEDWLDKNVPAADVFEIVPLEFDQEAIEKQWRSYESKANRIIMEES